MQTTINGRARLLPAGQGVVQVLVDFLAAFGADEESRHPAREFEEVERRLRVLLGMVEQAVAADVRGECRKDVGGSADRIEDGAQRVARIQ